MRAALLSLFMLPAFTIASGGVLADNILPNGDFERGFIEIPQSWMPAGYATADWSKEKPRTGVRCVSVANPSDEEFSGWRTVFPVTGGRSYRVGGYIHTGDLLDLPPGGGARMRVEFLAGFDRPTGDPVSTDPVGSGVSWTEVSTPVLVAPVDAVAMRVTVGWMGGTGTVWFDDCYCESIGTESVPEPVVERTSPAPSPALVYAPNLLPNGDVERGSGGRPDGWTYVGSSARDWTAGDIDRLHTNGRPFYSVGRGEGQWSRDRTYQGSGALLNISIDPPISKRFQWYGRNPVDGYWLSDPMPCTPGTGYFAGAWLYTDTPISSPWYGPLELQFFDAAGKQLQPAVGMRSGLSQAPGNEWTWWATPPWVAPSAAVTMRLRFGQELCANEGGWGHLFADNIAVWESPVPFTADEMRELSHGDDRFREWFMAAHKTVKPPYAPSPETAEPYRSCWGMVETTPPGNVFHDVAAPVTLTCSFANILGEARTLSLRIVRTDWLGREFPPVVSDSFRVDGWSTVRVPITLPAGGQYGSYHLGVDVLEGDAVVESFTGRYAVMAAYGKPPRDTVRWGVSPLADLYGDGRPFEKKLGKLLQMGGFDIAWQRIYFPLETRGLDREIERLKKVCHWYRTLGIEPVTILIPQVQSSPDYAAVRQAGERIASQLKGESTVFGNWGIELSNEPSYYRGGMVVTAYDSVAAALYEGLKAGNPDCNVLIGNIAADAYATTIRRMYGPPVNGRFDGAIVNMYPVDFVVNDLPRAGFSDETFLNTADLLIGNDIAEFDRHGDTGNLVWHEEHAIQASPSEGPSRRFLEVEGAIQGVRYWLTLVSRLQPRLKVASMWGFVGFNEGDLVMVTPSLQPRPHFVAHAVMSHTLDGAEYSADRSFADLVTFEYRRGNETILPCWTVSKPRTVTFRSDARSVTVTDLMGNERTVPVVDGRVTLELDRMPRYITANGKIASVDDVTAVLAPCDQEDHEAGCVAVTLSSAGTDTGPVELILEGPGEQTATASLPRVRAGEVVHLRVPQPVSPGEPYRYHLTCITGAGERYHAQALLTFDSPAQAVFADERPSLDGPWEGWSAAPVIPIGAQWSNNTPEAAGKPIMPDEDRQLRLYGMWDRDYLYLGMCMTTPRPLRIESTYGIGFPPSRRSVVEQRIAVPWKDLGIVGADAGMTIPFERLRGVLEGMGLSGKALEDLPHALLLVRNEQDR